MSILSCQLDANEDVNARDVLPDWFVFQSITGGRALPAAIELLCEAGAPGCDVREGLGDGLVFALTDPAAILSDTHVAAALVLPVADSDGDTMLVFPAVAGAYRGQGMLARLLDPVANALRARDVRRLVLRLGPDDHAPGFDLQRTGWVCSPSAPVREPGTWFELEL